MAASFLSRLFSRDASPAPVKPARDANPAALGAMGFVSPIGNAATGVGANQDPLNSTLFQQTRILQRVQVEAALVSCGEVQRIVNAIPSDALAPGFTLTDETDAAEPLADILRATDFARKVQRAAAMANLYGEAFLLPLVREDGMPPDLDRLREPLDLRRVTGIERFEIVLGALAREVTPAERQTSLVGEIPTGEPVIYRVIAARAGVMLGPVNVHASRMIKFEGNWLSPRLQLATPFYMPGEAMSTLQCCVYALYNWLESGNSNRRAQQEVSQKVLRTSAVPAPDAPQAYVDAVTARWSMFSLGSQLGVTVLDAGDGGSDPGEELSRLNFPVAGLADLDDGALSHLAAAIGWPKERLAGLQPSGLINSGSSWESGWFSLVNAWREQKLRGPMERAIEVLYAASGGLPESWALKFGDLGQPTPKEAAEIEKIEADTVAVYHDLGALPTLQIRRSKFGPDAQPPAGLQPATPDELTAPVVEPALPLAVRSDPVARAQAQQDAADGVVVALEVQPHPIMSAVRRILPDLVPEDWPHCTLVYVGDRIPDRAMGPIERAASASGPWPASLVPTEIGTLGNDGAVVIFLRRAGLDGGQSRLLRSLAPHVRAEQYPRFVPHVTVGYLGRELTDGERERLAAIDLAPLTASRLVVRAGDVVRVGWAV